MIWYDFSIAIIGTIFTLFLLTTALQILFILEAGELLQNKKELYYIRLYYSVLAAISLFSTLEMLMVIAAVEGGIFMAISAFYRYLVILPPILYFYPKLVPLDLSAYLRPLRFSFFAPLLRLPIMDRLYPPLPAALAIFVAIWFFLDSLGVLMSFIKFSRTQITLSILPQIIYNIESGICVAGRNNWILESNPAFYALCTRLGIGKPERTDEFETALLEFAKSGELEISNLENGRSIRAGDSIFFLQRSEFTLGKNNYLQLLISDVTRITSVAIELEQQNELLIQENERLENALAGIEQKEALQERERLCRIAHDIWSQRLAVAGLSIDMLKEDKSENLYKHQIEQILNLLETTIETEPFLQEFDLTSTLHTLSDMYRQLGVKIEIRGQVDFSPEERQALCAIIREALANAVRHAYARLIQITFFANDNNTGVAICNSCLDESTVIHEGRGIHDMISRAGEAGGQIHFTKDKTFMLQTIFPRT